MSTVQPVNTYRVHYGSKKRYTEHQARRLEIGVHGTLVLWGGKATEPRIVQGWAPGAWVHVELCE